MLSLDAKRPKHGECGGEYVPAHNTRPRQLRTDTHHTNGTTTQHVSHPSMTMHAESHLFTSLNSPSPMDFLAS
eukprot:26975-Eustigmatos_ZCMA.PRE.1